MTEKEAYVAFNLAERIGSVKVGELAAAAGSVAAAYEAYPAKRARDGGFIDWQAEFDQAARLGVELVTPADAEYPAALRAAPGHPLTLYVKGSVAVLDKAAIAIVGTRRATEYGLDRAYALGRDLAQAGWVVVSGLALGIDAEAHRGALAAHGLTVGVIGSALDRFYPPGNRELAREIVAAGGAVVSEFPFGRSPDTTTFPQRNHIVAALARGVVAVEAPAKSGTLITTAIAADLGRTVMAVPGRVDSRASAGCLALIREGARLVRDARDVGEEMSELPLGGKPPPPDGTAPRTRAPRPDAPPFSLEEAMIMKHVTAEGATVDELIRQTGLSAARVNSLTLALRVKERVRFLPGNRVALPREC